MTEGGVPLGGGLVAKVGNVLGAAVLVAAEATIFGY